MAHALICWKTAKKNKN